MRAKLGVFALAILTSFAAAFAQPAATQPTTAEAASQAFVRSLALRPERFITDSSLSSIVWLSQTSTAPYTPTAPLKLKLSLAPATAGAAATKELGTTDIYLRDFAASPFAASADFSSIADGSYRLIGTLLEGGKALTTLEKPILLVAGINSRQAEIEQRLSKITGHDGTKATIRYPFDLARVMNTGKRSWDADHLGINQARETNFYNFAAGMKHSQELLAALEAGKDPLWQAKGDTNRHYWLEEAGEISPYRVSVPPNWDGKTPLPMVFILHGDTRNQDFYFERDDRIIPKAAEPYGFMLVGPFGYYPNGGYNSDQLNRSARGGGGGGGGGGRAGGRGVTRLNGMPQSRMVELSEIDTMHVYDLVTKEYPVDPKRTFLFGYSHGGAGAYYLGAKHAQNWAAIALGGASTAPSDFYPFDRLKQFNIPMFIFFGDQDSATVKNNSPAFVDALKAKGIEAQLKIYPGINHDGAPGAAVADAFKFFSEHPRK